MWCGCKCGNEYGDNWALVAHLSLNYLNFTDMRQHGPLIVGNATPEP